MSGPEHHAVATGGMLASAARIIAQLERKRLPDLSGLIVLLPNLHAAGDFARALRAAAGVDTLLLPRMTTLRMLAEECDPGRPLLPPSRRQALVYRALREREWFRHADLWNVSAELVRLFDEITVCQATLPSSHAAFVRQLEQAYQARAGSPMQFEARLVHELWHAMGNAGDDDLDDAARYQLQLVQLADKATAPLYVVGLDDLSPLERGFFELYSRTRPVHWFREHDTMAETGTPAHFLGAAWADPEQHGHLSARCDAFRAAVLHSPLRQRLSLFGAHSLEQEASAIAYRVGQWLAQGKSAILVVVQDRLVARRARALLERDSVLVSDENGWTLSTTSASTVVMRWLDNLDSRFHFQDLLDLLKSPFIFSDWEPARRRHGVFRLEQIIRKHNLVSHLNRYRALASDQEVREILDTLDDARKFLDKRKTRSLAHWLQGLLDSLDTLQIRAGLAKDPAGEQLLQLLDQLGQELTADATPFRYTEWRQWLNLQLESAVFRDTSIVSPVIFTHLAATRLRRFDAAIIAGADAAHLPGSSHDSVFFNQTVRGALGLSQRKDAIEAEGRDLIALLSACPEVWVTWQARKNGKPNALSAWFERLETFHLLTYDISLCIDLDEETCFPARHDQARPPAPALPPTLIPTTISPSGYNSLVACPYQFHARHALRLNELDEVSLTLEKADYGEYVHLILHRFHRTHPVLTGQDPATLEQSLRAVGDQAFANVIAANFVSHAWKLRWEAAIPGYIQWQLKREQQGWRWREGELERTLPLKLEDGHALTLRGRLDRVDSNGASLAVLDYKTESKSILKKKLQDVGEDVQLPCYALLLRTPPSQAAFIAVDGEDTHLVEAEENIADLAQANRERLEEIFTALHQGAQMPAQGASQVCEYCEMRGLCRKDFWNALEPPRVDPRGSP